MRALAMYTPFLIVVTLACSAAVSGHHPAGLFLKPLRRADPLRRDLRADLLMIESIVNEIDLPADRANSN
jgi:hypothetical protein